MLMTLMYDSNLWTFTRISKHFKQTWQINQFTIEDKYDETGDNNGRYEFDVFHKPGLTKVQIKPHSCKPSSVITTISKGFLARATKIFSEKYLRAEVEYLTDKFCKNGYDRNTLQKITNNFQKKTRSINNNNNSSTNKQTTNFPWIPKIGPKIRKEIQSLNLE